MMNIYEHIGRSDKLVVHCFNGGEIQSRNTVLKGAARKLVSIRNDCSLETLSKFILRVMLLVALTH